MKKNILVLVATFLFIPAPVHANLHSQTVEYKQGDTALEGYLVYDEKYDSAKDKIPAIIVAHDWLGLEGYAKHRADMLAELGYVAFAIDIYGKGVRPKNPDEAGQQAGAYKNDRPLMRERAKAGYEFLKNYPLVDPNQIAAIGYCFGGTVALEMARGGLDLVGVATFHGGLSTPTPDDAKNIKGKILVLHGADDPFVTPAEVQAFRDEMKNANTDAQIISYAGAVHSFTRPDSGSDNSKGAAYNERADKLSWEDMKEFFGKIFH